MAKFATSARTVDMLGRQQIAGVPTALSELFKNSFDAYATRARADLFDSERILLLRDNGVGMSRGDFEDRWLTLGTSSKLRLSDWASSTLTRPPGMQPRPVMGEKGIGRLAIASLGSQTIVMSRAITTSATAPRIVVALVPWTLFEIPGMLLEDVDLPVTEVDSVDELDRSLLMNLSSKVMQWLNVRSAIVPNSISRRIADDLQMLDFDVQALIRRPGPTLDEDSHGTQFVVLPINSDLPASLEPPEGAPREEAISPLEKLLVGFTDTMSSDLAEARMLTRFVRHDQGTAKELLAAEDFWTPTDFKLADHEIRGSFDEFGTFQGYVSVYKGDPTSHVISWPTSASRPTRCGPFDIHIGYVQGNLSDSSIPPDQFADIDLKLRRIGGLYVYRDGLRVQPYGDSSVDYLRIEERRSRNAGHYYFSYRRMFGAIRISASDNPALQDKASREGLRENAAFRDFRDVLENFLVQLARDFFRAGASAEMSETWQAGRERARTQQRQRKQLDAKNKAQRQAYMEELTTALRVLETGGFSRSSTQILSELDERLGKLGDKPSPTQLAALEDYARAAVEDLVSDVKVTEPIGTALTPEESRERAAYQVAFQRTVTSELPGIIGEIVSKIEHRTISSADVAALRQERNAVLDERKGRSLRELYSAESEARDSLALVERRVTSTTSSGRSAVNEATERASSIFRDLAPSRQQELLEQVEAASELAVRTLRSAAAALTTIALDELMESPTLLQEQVLDLQQQADANIELLLLGQAVQVVDHELENTTSAVRSSLQNLRRWSRANPALSAAVENVATPFQHLDSYLRLLTPLQRRLNRKRTRITGTSIESYLLQIFQGRLRRSGAVLISTPSFLDSSVYAFPSTMLSAFVNLVDNALHWANYDGEQDQAVVELSTDEVGLTISDNGPGVTPRDRMAIFERGFSRRPGGRGLGLTIAKEALRRDGFVLELLPPKAVGGESSGASFRIRPESGEDSA